jgi:hypothetical protein
MSQLSSRKLFEAFPNNAEEAALTASNKGFMVTTMAAPLRTLPVLGLCVIL